MSYITWGIYIIYFVAFTMTCTRVYEVWPSLSQGTGRTFGKLARVYRSGFQVIKDPLLLAHSLISLSYLLITLMDIPGDKGEAMTWIFEVIIYSLSFLLSAHFIHLTLNEEALTLPQLLRQDLIKTISTTLSKQVEEQLPLTLKIAFLGHLIDLSFSLIFPL